MNRPTLLKFNINQLHYGPNEDNTEDTASQIFEKIIQSIDIKGLAISLNVNKDDQSNYTTQKKMHEMRSAHQKSDIKGTLHESMGFKSQSNLKHSRVLSSEFNLSKRVKPSSNDMFRQIKDEREALELDYLELRKSETFILYPLNIHVRIIKEISLAKDFTHNFAYHLSINISDPIILTLNRYHMQYLGSLKNHMQRTSIIQKNIHMRPFEFPKEKPAAWWKYAITSVIEERKRQNKFTMSHANLIKMRRYIELYKRDQTIVRPASNQ